MHKILFWISSFVAWALFGVSILAAISIAIGFDGGGGFGGNLLGTSVAVFITGGLALLFYGCANQKIVAHGLLLLVSAVLVFFDIQYLYLLGASVIVALPALVFFVGSLRQKHVTSQSSRPL